MYYVVDTHAFIWYLTDSSRLSQKARKIFELGDQGKAILVIPAIVLLECIDIFDKKKVSLRFDEVLAKITHAENFLISEVNLGLLLETNRLKGFVDLHDRVIVATAKLFDAPLVSRDRMIRQCYSKTIW